MTTQPLPTSEAPKGEPIPLEERMGHRLRQILWGARTDLGSTLPPSQSRKSAMRKETVEMGNTKWRRLDRRG